MDQLDFRQFFELQINRIAAAGFGSSDDFLGASAEEVSDVGASQGVLLPGGYVAFLEVMGRAAGPLFSGSDVTFPDILWFRSAAERIADDVETDISSLGVVFLIHRGYDVTLLGREGDNPAVFRLTDSMSRFEKISDSFTEFFRAEVEQLLTSRRFDIPRRAPLTMEQVMGLISQRNAKRRGE